MLIETWVDTLLHKVRPRKTFNELLAEDKEREILLAEDTQRAIRRQEYDLHMSLAKIEAMEDWTHNRNIRKEFKR